MAYSTKRRNYLELVASAARLSCVYVAENAYEAWFQMYGRMVWYGQHCERTIWFLLESKGHAPRPWVKPSEGILENAGEVLEKLLALRMSVMFWMYFTQEM